MPRRAPVPWVAALAAVIAAPLVISARAEGSESAPAQPGATAEVAEASPPPLEAILKFGEAWARFYVILQPRYEAIQDVNTGGYSQNWYLRRARFIVFVKLGQTVGEGVQEVELLFHMDSSRIGNAAPPAGTKNIGTTGFLVQDAYGQWALGGNAVALQAGLWIVPSIRQAHVAPSTFLGLDGPTWGFQQNTPLAGLNTRDYGVGLNGYLLDDRLSYRIGAFSGNREAPILAADGRTLIAACCRNSPRFASRVMYDFFDPEKGYVYYGTSRGAKRIVAIGAVAEAQGSYEGFGGDVFVDWPIGLDAATFEADYLHYSGWGKFYAASIPEQESLFVNAGWYFGAVKLQPFVKYELLHYAADINQTGDQTRFGGGVNYYAMGQNLKITPYFERIVPKVQPATARQKDANHFVIQLQVFL